MKLKKKTIIKAAATFTALILLADSFPALTASADSLPEETAETQESVFLFEEEMPEETQAPTSETQASLPSDEELSQEMITQELTENTQGIVTEESSTQSESSFQETTGLTQNIAEEEMILQSSKTALQEQEAVTAGTEPIGFHADIELSTQGYRVVGTFTEFPPGIIHLQQLCSQNNKTYEECGIAWNLPMIEANHVAETKRFICLNSNNEPLRSYLEGSLDHFYLKVRLTDDNGFFYETQTVLIERGAPQPLPEDITAGAFLASSICVREMRPFRRYGRYQITVKETAAPKKISAVLPDTLPIEVQFMKNGNAYATGIIDCPVSWKSLSLPSLAAGESVSIEDAAEEIVIPGGTLVQTPIGTFRLDEPLGVGDDIFTDDVKLVLNVVSKDEKPTGALTKDQDCLKLAFHLKPTGATSIRAYTISEGEKKWTALSKSSELALSDAVNAQPSTASSGYALVLDKEQEPYRSYFATEMAGGQPTPFFVGLEIKGGVYDGQQLILAWPGSYELPLQLPKLGGAGGNESNAGAANKGDSTSEGQRPNLPQDTDRKKEEQTPENITNITNNTTSDTVESTLESAIENMEELPTQPDTQNQQTPEKTSAFKPPLSKVQAATVPIPEESTSGTDTTADMQTDALTESTTVSETTPDANKLSAALISSSQSETTAPAAKKENHPLFLWIMVAAVIGLGIVIHTIHRRSLRK